MMLVCTIGVRSEAAKFLKPTHINRKINRKLNTFTYSEYVHLLEHYRKCTAFNILGLFRLITENHKLDLEQKLNGGKASGLEWTMESVASLYAFDSTEFIA